MFNITNYNNHPTRPGYEIFNFYEKRRAEYFEELLIKDNVWFESTIEESEKTVYFFGVKKSDHQKTMNSNYLVSAKFRKKIIPNMYFRWFIIALSSAILTLAILSAIKS